MMIDTQRFQVSVGEAAVSAVIASSARSTSSAVILAPGAGNDMDSPFLTTIHRGLAARGLTSVRFNFLYHEQGRKAPDPVHCLQQVWRAVIDRVGDELRPARLYIGGKSMGGRIASLLVAEGLEVDGLILLGYPLHPAGRPEKLRSAHFPAISRPALFVAGTRDPLCRLDLLEPAMATLGGPATLHVIENGDHSFMPPKSLGRDPTEVLAEVVQAVRGWIDALEAPSAGR